MPRFLPCLILPLGLCLNAAALDLSQAVIQVETPDSIKPKVVEMLQEEIEERTGVVLPIEQHAPRRAPAIVLSTVSEDAMLPEGLTLPDHAEAYAVHITHEGRAPRVHLTGRESRGVLYAVGRLLRELELSTDGTIALDDGFSIATAPVYAFRGHQMGYRNTANSYDLWTVEDYEQYIRDLAMFGTNGVELISAFISHPDDYANARQAKDGPLLAVSQWEMNLKLAALLQSYGLDVWVWEALEGDVTKPEIAEAEMKWRREFYNEMPHIDHIFVPGGDPGRTHPSVLLPWLERQAGVLHERFPEAKLWVSNQKFTPEENDIFFTYLEENHPAWLAGVAYGPGTELSVQEVRDRLPQQYPIRHYPDITHNVRCQFPVPGLDRIIAQTLGREGINPRPLQMKGLFQVISPPTNGFVSYSDGCHDDVNKAVFSSLGWDPEMPVEEIVDDYAKVFFGQKSAEEAAAGLFAFEQVFTQPIAENESLDAALARWQELGQQDPALHSNWRYQMFLFRAMFDALVRARLLVEQEFEDAAYAALREAPEMGAAKAIETAQRALAQADLTAVRPELRLAMEELGLTLLKSIGLQLSIDPPYRARNPERGALLDKIDRPLNDRPWLEVQFARILAEADETQKLASIAELVNWEDPGPGGFYDDLGNIQKQPHLVRQTVWKDDPGFDHGPFEAFYRQMDNSTKLLNPIKLSWTDYIETPARTPIVLRYEGLDPGARYKVRATYFGRYGAIMRLVADGKHEISKAQGIPDPLWPLEFDIPQQATSDGALELAWSLVANRGCQLAEVWLIREP